MLGGQTRKTMHVGMSNSEQPKRAMVAVPHHAGNLFIRQNDGHGRCGGVLRRECLRWACLGMLLYTVELRAASDALHHPWSDLPGFLLSHADRTVAGGECLSASPEGQRPKTSATLRHPLVVYASPLPALRVGASVGPTFRLPAGTYASATADMLRPRLERGSPTSYWLGVVRAPHLNPVRDGGKKPQWQFCYTTTGQDAAAIAVDRFLFFASIGCVRQEEAEYGGRSRSGGGGLWRLADEMNPPEVGCRAMEAECVRRFHRHEPKENQCSSSVVKHIKAPVHLVISLSCFFGFEIGGLVSGEAIRSATEVQAVCEQMHHAGGFCSRVLEEVNIKSGLPATTSTERLEQLDDNEHILSIKIVGGDHRLQNYSSVVTAHPEIIDGRPGTLVIESFVVDVPEENTKAIPASSWRP
ncbi:hypothetical protein MUK42_25027 [Musa troglodytarum]|uniref:Uncharacterized protein n=1 Tax=Musa troglodytarum TaxID=320322 RepID=A0A9E7L6E8_9LILI|nr:hypothetical protein MUK42_25027 [Musa troglodytarum]URE42236.1 hypothetical protein MUK42_25027 [Musa troglodytarum]